MIFKRVFHIYFGALYFIAVALYSELYGKKQDFLCYARTSISSKVVTKVEHWPI